MTLEGYYRKRVQEYEHIYHRPDPVRQAEQQELASAVKRAMAGRKVLEIACGTGYWTQSAADTAAKIIATDLSEETLDIARAKDLPQEIVTFKTADAFALTADDGPFDAGLSMFWISHVPRARLQEFLRGFHAVLAQGATVLIADNRLVEGIGGNFVQKIDDENTYKIRTLDNGTQHEILKNYFEETELRQIFVAVQNLRIEMRQCFWWVEYTV